MKKIFAAISLFLFSFVLYSQDIKNSEPIKNNSENEFFDYRAKGDLDKIRELLEKGTDVNSTNSKGWSALHAAVKANNIAVLKELLSHKEININYVLPSNTYLKEEEGSWDASGQTPILLALYYGYANIVNMILSYGADVLVKDTVDEAMPIRIASAKGNANVVSVILNYSALKKLGIDMINVGDGTGTTPLMWIAMNNQITVITTLIKYKADIDLQDSDGWTALHFSAYSGSYNATDILLKIRQMLI